MDEQRKKYRQIHKEKIKKQTHDYFKNHQKHLQDWQTEYRHAHKKQYRGYIKKHRLTKKGIETFKCCKAHYERNKKWILVLPNIFPENISIDYHHIDGKWFVVPLPSEIHERTYNTNIDKHLNEANDWIEFYYDINPNDFLKEGEK